MRKKPYQKRPTVVMRGRVEQLVRYVLSTPTAHHKEYRLVCGGQEYGLGRVEALARELIFFHRRWIAADGNQTHPRPNGSRLGVS